jgi:hypothetical protein
MTLDDYLRMPGASAAKLAAAAGCSPTTITRARAGLQLPRPKVVRAIYVATKGADALDVEERLIRCVRDGERGCRVELGLRVLAFCGQDAMDEALASVGYCGARPIEATDEVTPDRALIHLLETSAALAKAWEDRRLTNDEAAHVAKLIRNLLPVLGDLLRQTSETAG